MKSIYVYDTAVKDTSSKVRGIGRYIQILKENLPQDTVFTSDLSLVPYESILINPFIKFLQNPIINRRIAKTQIAVIHDLITLKYPQHFPIGIRGRISIFLNKSALSNYDCFLTDSVSSQKDIVNILKIKADKIKVIYPCLPKIFDSSRLSSNNNAVYSSSEHIRQAQCRLRESRSSDFCLYVGDATWNKNLVNLAKAIKLTNVTCVFAGKVFEPFKSVRTDSVEERSGKTESVNEVNHIEQKELKEFLELANGDKNFILKGFVEDTELIKLYAETKCNILVSRDEGFGFSYLEASNSKTPSLLSNITVFKEIAGDTALYCNPEDPQDIANKIKELSTNESLRQDLGEKAYKKSQFFSQEKFREALLSLRTQ